MASSPEATESSRASSSSFQKALDDAERLMEELDVTAGDDDDNDDNGAALPNESSMGFSIDSDDEDDCDLDVLAMTGASGASAGASASPTPPPSLPGVPQPQPVLEESVDFHPLQMLNTEAETETETTQQWQQSQSQSPQRLSFLGGTTVTPTRAQQTSPSSNHLMPSATSGSSSSSSSYLQENAFRFASNLAGFAQRAATQVVAVAEAAQHQQQQQPPQPQFQPPHVQQQQYQFQQQQQQQQQPLPTASFELDKDQKNALVEKKVHLLPGESVTMFLAPLLYVADASARVSYQYNNPKQSYPPKMQQQPPAIVWCCAMTFYRVILFASTITGDNGDVTTSATSTTTTSTPTPPPLNWNASCWPPPPADILQMPLASMERLEKSVFTVTTNSGETTMMGLTFTGKDNGRMLRFVAPSHADTLRAYEALQTYAFPGRRNLGYLFAFESKRKLVLESVVADPTTGQKQVTCPPCNKRFDALTEFQRLGIIRSSSHDGSNATCPWKVWTTVNNSYQLCMSYPNIVVGPASIDVSSPEGLRMVRQTAAFRSEHRLPALTWCAFHNADSSENNCSGGGGSLWRCSQPKVGLQGNRSTADEVFLKHILESAAAANLMSATTASSSASSPALSLTLTQVVYLTGCSSSQVANWMLPMASSSSTASSQLPQGSPLQFSQTTSACLKILDLRPRSSAMANRTGGYGYENTSNYQGSTIQFCNIGNIHAVRDAYQKISALCMQSSYNSANMTSDLQWNVAVEDTKWLGHLRLILAASWEAAWWVHVHRLPVLLHCSHGWDRTSQVAVLAQLLLDPYYRTCAGFATVVEKDFSAFGHPFHTRCAHGEGRGENSVTSGMNGVVGSSAAVAAVTGQSSDEGQISPIFLQFLDCVFQLVNQFPECFEFNTKYLLVLSEHVYSCRFGNFLCDTERERELVAGIRQRTHSLWDYLDEQRRDEVRNPGFDPNKAGGVLLMPLPLLLRNVTLWTDRHCMYAPKPTVRWIPNDNNNNESINKSLYETDQQGPLTTEKEKQAWIAQRTILQQQQQQLLASLLVQTPTNVDATNMTALLSPVPPANAAATAVNETSSDEEEANILTTN